MEWKANILVSMYPWVVYDKQIVLLFELKKSHFRQL